MLVSQWSSHAATVSTLTAPTPPVSRLISSSRAAEADRVQLAVSDQLIRLGPADREQLGRLLDVQEPRTGPFGVVVVHGDLLMLAGVYQERADFPANW